MPDDRAAPPADYARFLADVEKARLIPLWERFKSGQPREPRPEPPQHWRWADVAPLIDRATRAVSVEDAERRVLQLRNPDPRVKEVAATTNINCGFQILLPGETARPHRHSANALRFVIEGAGATTIVDGKPCPMGEGDMILNPGMVWHAHRHDGSGRVVWLDVLDVPLWRQFDTGFFEPGPPPALPDAFPDAAYGTGGFVPVADTPARAHSPLYRYGWAEAAAALAAMPEAADGSRTLRYVDPVTGAPALGLLDCFLVALAPGRASRRRRSTANAVCLVVEGAGETTVGETTIAWSRRDVFTVPHWSWASHRTDGGPARLFVVTDREVLRRLGMLADQS